MPPPAPTGSDAHPGRRCCGGSSRHGGPRHGSKGTRSGSTRPEAHAATVRIVRGNMRVRGPRSSTVPNIRVVPNCYRREYMADRAYCRMIPDLISEVSRKQGCQHVPSVPEGIAGRGFRAVPPAPKRPAKSLMGKPLMGLVAGSISSRPAGIAGEGAAPGGPSEPVRRRSASGVSPRSASLAPGLRQKDIHP